MSKWLATNYVWRVVETDNLGGDYPKEQFVNIAPTTKERAQKIADAINEAHCRHEGARRYWKVVDKDYVLQPGFEP